MTPLNAARAAGQGTRNTLLCVAFAIMPGEPRAAPNGGYANSHDCRVSCDLRSVDCRGAGRRSWGVHRLGRATDRGPAVAGQEAGGGHGSRQYRDHDRAVGEDQVFRSPETGPDAEVLTDSRFLHVEIDLDLVAERVGRQGSGILFGSALPIVIARQRRRYHGIS